MIPTVLFRCAEFLEAKGVDEVGLYRYAAFVFVSAFQGFFFLGCSGLMTTEDVI